MLGIDVAFRTFSGRRLTPQVVPAISTFVVKIFELCNINCTYCYMYNLKDVSYLKRPKSMSPEIRDAMIARIREHARQHKLEHIAIQIHGGEPLLAGKAYIEDWVTAVRNGLSSYVQVRLSMQTNGILLDAEWADLLGRLGIGVGISIDGPKPHNDKYRVDHSGAGTYDRAIAGLRHLAQKRDGRLDATVLSVANPDISPTALWEFWIETGATNFDFLLPHHTHDDPPPFDRLALAGWMIELFDLWWRHDNPVLEIRYFRNIINLILGAQFSMDYLGGKPTGLAVIESDGAITGYDTLRACAEGLIELGMTVFNQSLDDVRTHPIFRLCNHSGAFLSEKCAGCRVHNVCGGGFITHRYSRASGFNNPSVHCDSLFAIISHIEQRITEELHLTAKSERSISMNAL